MPKIVVCAIFRKKEFPNFFFKFKIYEIYESTLFMAQKQKCEGGMASDTRHLRHALRHTHTRVRGHLLFRCHLYYIRGYQVSSNTCWERILEGGGSYLCSRSPPVSTPPVLFSRLSSKLEHLLGVDPAGRGRFGADPGVTPCEVVYHMIHRICNQPITAHLVHMRFVYKHKEADLPITWRKKHVYFLLIFKFFGI